MHNVRRVVRSVAVVWVVGLTFFSSLTQALPTAAAASETSAVSVSGVGALPPTSTTADPLVTAAAQSEAGVSGANTPQRTGRDQPPRGQRTSDTLIWLFLVLTLIVGILLAVFSERVRSTPRSPRDKTQPGR